MDKLLKVELLDTAVEATQSEALQGRCAGTGEGPGGGEDLCGFARGLRTRQEEAQERRICQGRDPEGSEGEKAQLTDLYYKEKSFFDLFKQFEKQKVIEGHRREEC